MKRTSSLSFLILALFMTLLNGCGGGSGGASGSQNVSGGEGSAVTPSPAPAPVPTILSGIVSKGPVSGGSVTAYSIVNGIQSSALANGATDTLGNYTLNLGSYSGPVLIAATGGQYTDEATGNLTSLTYTLRTAIDNVTGTLSASVTPLTEVAVKNAVAAGGMSAANILTENNAIKIQVGFDPVTTMPDNAISLTAGTASNAAKAYAVYLGTVAQYMQIGSKTLDVATTDFAAAVKADGGLTSNPSIIKAGDAFGANANNKTGVTNMPALITLSNNLTNPSTTQYSLQTGQRIMAAPDVGVNVRDQTLSSVLFPQTAGVHGTLMGVPVNATAGGVSGNWWRITWDSAPPNFTNAVGGNWSIDKSPTTQFLSLAPSAGDRAKPDLNSDNYTSDKNIYWRDGQAPVSSGAKYTVTDPNNTLYFDPNAEGNCTWYAYGRALELGADPAKLKVLSSNAGEWANQAKNTGFSVDTKPTVGSIAQLNSIPGSFKFGHVAVVESVSDSDQTITVTESAYSPGLSSPWNFLWRHRTVSQSWFSNFIRVPQTTLAVTPSVSLVSPTSMTANNVSQTLVISGSGFAPGNQVQFKWGQGAGANIWTSASGSVTVNSSSQITISINPGTVTDTIYARVCSSNGSSSCSSGTQYVSVTAPSATLGVSSVSPTGMTANGVSQSLVISGSSFASGNQVQFMWGQGTGANVWTPASGSVTVNSSSQITVTMNPGSVTDTIYVRVCSSSGSSSCSKGTQYISVTAPTVTPSVSSVSPASMTANNNSQSLVISGSGFASGNQVQFMWSQGPGANVWNPASGSVTVNSSSQITVSMNPGTVTDRIYARVCGSNGSSSCSSGMQYVSVTAPTVTPSVSSVSPTSMTANGVSQSLVISGSGFASGNQVQFMWGQGTGANLWTLASGSVTVNSSSQITVNMNPGTVSDTIYVRVCSSTGSSSCSNGMSYVSVTAPSVTPSVSSVSPTSMAANGVSHSLVISGSGFASGNQVQFMWGQGTGANVWHSASGSVTVNSSSQITVSMNPGTVTDRIYVRVCSSNGSSSCSSGTQYVSVL